MIPPKFPAIKERNRHPNRSSRRVTPTAAPLIAKTNVPMSIEHEQQRHGAFLSYAGEVAPASYQEEPSKWEHGFRVATIMVAVGYAGLQLGSLSRRYVPAANVPLTCGNRLHLISQMSTLTDAYEFENAAEFITSCFRGSPASWPVGWTASRQPGTLSLLLENRTELTLCAAR